MALKKIGGGESGLLTFLAFLVKSLTKVHAIIIYKNTLGSMGPLDPYLMNHMGIFHSSKLQ